MTKTRPPSQPSRNLDPLEFSRDWLLELRGAVMRGDYLKVRSMLRQLVLADL
jgi:hypothetical protein